MRVYGYSHSSSKAYCYGYNGTRYSSSSYGMCDSWFEGTVWLIRSAPGSNVWNVTFADPFGYIEDGEFIRQVTLPASPIYLALYTHLDDDCYGVACTSTKVQGFIYDVVVGGIGGRYTFSNNTYHPNMSITSKNVYSASSNISIDMIH